jgi:DNA repair protein RadC
MSHLKPREKANLLGLQNVQDHELIAILLGSGTHKYPVTTLAKHLLAQYPISVWKNIFSNSNAGKMHFSKSLKKSHSFNSSEKFQKIPGCGPVKSLQLQACIELGRRIFMPPTPPVISTSNDIYVQLAYLANRTREEVVCFYLNARNELISKQTVAVGGLNYSSLHPRDVFAPALMLPCASIILGHNHPSGNVEPSSEDIRVTKVLHAAGKLLGIELIDHVIVAANKHTSLAELGLIERS